MSLARPWKGVLFDLDGTLADTVELILMSYRHTMRTHLGDAPPDERWLSTMGTPLRDQLAAFARGPAEAAAMLETYTTFQRRVHDDIVRPFPGACDVLASLRRRGSRVGIVTSKRVEVARRTLSVCGLDAHVETLVCAEHVRRGKPDPEAVVIALAALGLADDPAETLFVGDSPFDLRAGRAAGTRTAAVCWGACGRETLAAEAPDYLLERVEELLELAPAS
ncbi:MAG: HAD-IA family hydrolase [Gemmatimonadales bacterium]